MTRLWGKTMRKISVEQTKESEGSCRNPNLAKCGG